MASEQPESVIARLMGLNKQLLCQEPFYKRCRVLSDWYVEKAASVGAREGNQIFVRRSCSLYGKSSSAAKTLPRVSKDKYDITLQNCSRSTALQASVRSQTSGGVIVPELLSVPCYKGKADKLDVHPKTYLGEKLHHGPAISKITSIKCSHITCKRTMNRNSQQQKRISKPEVVFGPGYIGECYSINQPEAWVSSSPCIHSYNDYIHTRHIYPMKSPLTVESVNRNLEKWKIPKEIDHTKVFERGQNIDEMLVSANRNSVGRSLNSRSGRIGRGLKLDLFSRRDKSKKQNILQKDSVEPGDGRGLMQLQLSTSMDDAQSEILKASDSAKSYFSCAGSDYSMPEVCGKGNPCKMGETYLSKSSNSDPPSQYAIDENLDCTEAFSMVCSVISAELPAEFRPGAVAMEDKISSHLPESFSEEVLSLKEISEQDFTSSSCFRLSPQEFQDHIKGNNQRSPASVLESFEPQKLNFSECSESFDMLLLLQDLDFELDETYSEGSVMVVSGDEDSAEGFNDICCDKRKIHKWSDESRDFSYLVDVLDEAGLCSVKSFMDLKYCDAIECPISYMVFESLEKKYGKQTSLPKSERRLLFDRINAGLMDIINPATNTNGCETSTRRCFGEAWKRENIEDALWKMLLHEEKEKTRDLSMKALGRAGKWMELEEESSIICRELESLLFEELVMEFVCSVSD